MAENTLPNETKTVHILRFFSLNWIKDRIEPWIPTTIKQSVVTIIDDFTKWFFPIKKSNALLLIHDDEKELILADNHNIEINNPPFLSLVYWLWVNIKEGLFCASQNSTALFMLIMATQIVSTHATGEFITPTPTSTPFPTTPESTKAPATTNFWDSDVARGVMSGGVSGFIIITFLCFKLYTEHKTRKRLDEIPEGESMTERMTAYRSTLVLPLARIIFDNTKVTNYFGTISDQGMTEYLQAIETLTFALLEKGLLRDFETLSDDQQSFILQKVADEARIILVSRARASSMTCCRFFPPQIKPSDIKQYAEEIAQRVQSIQSEIQLPIDEEEQPEVPLLRAP
jgi:hypothetical protein